MTHEDRGRPAPTEAEGPAPKKGIWERVFDFWILLILAASVLNEVLRSVLNQWPVRVAIMIILIGGGGALLRRARNRQRRERLSSLATTHGSFEGWLRHPNALPDSLRRRWAYGTVGLTDGSLVFQPLSGEDGPAIGKPSSYTGLIHLGPRDVPTKERDVPRKWSVVALGTEQGEIELRVPPEGESVLNSLVE
jgi:hypothetical protein